MRRAPLVITATAVGLAGVLSFQTRRPSAAGSTPVATSPPTTIGRRATTAPHSTPTRRRRHGSRSQAPGPTATTAPSAQQATGKIVPYGYGQLAVDVTVSGSKITDVSVVGLQTAEQYSQQLAQQVIPTLRSETLSAQNANISAVSGASYTSHAYATSLQSALDKLHR